MAYPRENLHANEKLVLDLHPHWWFFTPSLAALVASVLVGLIVVFSDVDVQALNILVALVILVTLVWFATRYVQWATTDLVLTSDRLIWRTGVIAKRGIEIPLDRINTIFFSQKIWERLLGVGDLTIESASAQGAQNFENMKHPSRIQNEIYVQKEEAEEARYHRYTASHGSQPPPPGDGDDLPPPPSPQSPPSSDTGEMSIPDQIERLAALRDSGAITRADFDAKKAELLDRM